MKESACALLENSGAMDRVERVGDVHGESNTRRVVAMLVELLTRNTRQTMDTHYLVEPWKRGPSGEALLLSVMRLEILPP